jgi:hypothetical protein
MEMLPWLHARWGSASYVKWNEATITANESTTGPVDAQRIAFYSKAHARLSYPRPAHWSAAEVTAHRLTVNGREPFPFHIQDGQIGVDNPALRELAVALGPANFLKIQADWVKSHVDASPKKCTP